MIVIETKRELQVTVQLSLVELEVLAAGLQHRKNAITRMNLIIEEQAQNVATALQQSLDELIASA